MLSNTATFLPSIERLLRANPLSCQQTDESRAAILSNYPGSFLSLQIDRFRPSYPEGVWVDKLVYLNRYGLHVHISFQAKKITPPEGLETPAFPPHD